MGNACCLWCGCGTCKKTRTVAEKRVYTTLDAAFAFTETEVEDVGIVDLTLIKGMGMTREVVLVVERVCRRAEPTRHIIKLPSTNFPESKTQPTVKNLNGLTLQLAHPTPHESKKQESSWTLILIALNARGSKLLDTLRNECTQQGFSVHIKPLWNQSNMRQKWDQYVTPCIEIRVDSHEEEEEMHEALGIALNSFLSILRTSHTNTL